MIKMYYGGESVSENERIQPVPKFSINQNPIFANDVIIGYFYTLELNGVCSKIDSAEDLGIRDIRHALYGMEYIRSLLMTNGKILTVLDEDDNELLVAKGGILKSLNFDTGNKSWTQNIPYSCSIEFNELLLMGESITCSSGYVDTNSITSHLVDINTHKIAQFSDSWSFNIEDEAQNFALTSDNGSTLDVYDTVINISYNLSATGKNYFVSESGIVPAWLNAKSFVQERLYNQVKNIDGILALNGLACSPTKTLTEIHELVPASGNFNDIGLSYSIYNEKITCSCSESDGTFGLNYSAILKKDEDNEFSSGNIIHNFTKESSYAKQGNRLSITINGDVQGLCEGGIVFTSGNFMLPNEGTLLVSSNNNNRFSNAETFLSKILDTNYTDLSFSFKDKLNILSEISGTVPEDVITCTSGLEPTTFSLTKNYTDGTISYSVGYSSDRYCGRSIDGKTIAETTIVFDNPVPVLIETPIPNGNFIIQDIGTYTSKKITLSSSGRTDRLCCFSSDFLTQFCLQSLEDFLSFIDFPAADDGTLVTTEKQFTYDPLNGSYTLNIGYTCGSGCDI